MRISIIATAMLGIAALGQPGSAAARDSLSAPAPSTSRPQQVAATAPGTATSPVVQDQQSDSIAAVVDTDIVTDHELQQRIALFAATAGAPLSPETIKRMRPQILDQLEGEKIQIAEAKRKNITISAPEIDKSIDRIVNDNHMTVDQLKATLARNGVEYGTLRAQIAAQILWQKVVSDEFADRINITPADVDAEYARVMASRYKRHYNVSEIFLPVDNPEQDAKVLKNVQDIEAQLQAGAPFQATARQFSQSPSAASGGEIGWVYDGQLAPELNQTLANLTVGSVSQPVRSIGGYYILAVRERQEPEGTKVADAPKPVAPTDRLPLAVFLLPLGSNPPQKLVDGAMRLAGQVSSNATSCAQLDAIHAKVQGSVVSNMGEMKLTDLSDQVRDAVMKAEPGHSTPPLMTAAGVEIVMRCDKAIPKTEVYTPPTKDQIQEQLFDEQVTAFARRYMRDLRRQADVEAR